MASRGLTVGLALVIAAVMWACSSAQPGCQTVTAIAGLQPCLAYITSNSSTPTPQCCTQLANLVQSQAQCLCTFLNAAPPLPFNINRTQTIALPGACNIQAPPLSQCNAQSGPLVPGAPAMPTIPGTPSGPSNIPGIPSGPLAPGAPPMPTIPGIPSGPSNVPGIPSGPSVPAAGSPQAAPAPTSPVTPTAPSGASPPTTSTPSATTTPSAKGGSKAGPTKSQQSSSATGSAVLTPSLVVVLLAASAFAGF